MSATARDSGGPQGGMTLNEDSTVRKKRVIIVVTDCRFTGDLLCAYVETECHYPCTVAVGTEELPAAGEGHRAERIALIDCHEKNRDDILEVVKTVVASGAKPVLFDVHGGNGVVRESIQLGVRGFIYTHDPAVVLKKAFQAIFDGELWIERRMVADLLMGETHREYPHHERGELTTRECDILSLLRDGARNEEIAHRLNISPHTVKTHLYHIFRKIEAPNRLHAALWASQHLQGVLRKPAEHF